MCKPCANRDPTNEGQGAASQGPPRSAFRPWRLRRHQAETRKWNNPCVTDGKTADRNFFGDVDARPVPCRCMRNMNNEKRSEYFTRDGLMKLLSDDEIAKVTADESATALVDGDEYVDLEELDKGVRTVAGSTAGIAVGRVVAKKALQQGTWDKVVAQLASRRIVPVKSGESVGSLDRDLPHSSKS